MIFYLRDSNNKNYFEVDAYADKDGFDVRAHVYSYNYCLKIIELKENNKDFTLNKWLKLLQFLEEFRGWFWEEYLSTKKFIGAVVYKDIEEKLRQKIEEVDLRIVID